MNQNTAIQWTEVTWNPVTGCDKVSPGCKFCYAENLATGRMQAMNNPRYRNGFQVTLHHDLLELPRHWKKPRVIFVNSMSDLFHKDIPLEFIQRVFATMIACPQHTFQVLTKRSDILVRHAPHLQFADNIWIGVSVENGQYVQRIDHLRQVPAKVRFLSLEPLLGPLPNLNLDGIHWVIVGGESGVHHRHMDPAWVRDIRDQCVAARIPFFFKQWSGTRPKSLGRDLDGRTWDEMP